MGQLLCKHEDQLGRGLTYDLWKGFPAHEILVLKDANEGIGCMLDPASPPYAKAGVGSTGMPIGNGICAFVDTTDAYITGLTHAQYPGGHGFRMGGTTDNQAAELQFCGGAEPFVISDGTTLAAEVRELIFEVQFRLSTITTNELGLFMGLAGRAALDGNFLADNVPTAATPGVADIDMIGLFMDHADTSGLDIMYQLAGQEAVTHEAAWKTLAIDTWYTFGMRFLPVTKKLNFYWGTGDRVTKLAIDDNPVLSTDIDDTTFPDNQGLAPTFAVKLGGQAEYLDIRAFACAQRAYAAD